jgi:hypothetical protein
LSRALASALVLGALVFGAPGCTALTSQDPTPIRCFVNAGDPDPCPEGLQCVGEVCVVGGCQMIDPCNGVDDDCDSIVDEGAITTPACSSGVCVSGLCRAECVPEICDGLDNDCDGTPDNGLSIDADSDGYMACDTENPARTDCDDGNDAIHPMAREACNGFDDDCNGGTAESARGVCADDETCRTVEGERTPRCLNLADCLDLISCTAPQVCDEATARCCNPGDVGCMPIGDCRTVSCGGAERCIENDAGVFACAPPLANGDACRADADCESERCYPYASLALTPPGGTSTLGVCGSPCCDLAGCASHNGTVCWAPGTGARACVPASLLGAAAPSYTLCDEYADCGSDYCAARSVATPGGTGGAYTCGPAPGSADITCSTNADCVTGFCYNFICRYPCANDATCSATIFCLSGTEACVFLPSGGGRLAGCACREGGDGGASCGSNADCLDNYCVPGANVCARSCCSDASCGTGEHCTPVPTGTTWAMHCLGSAGPG